jgi:imidazolonepropionase
MSWDRLWLNCHIASMAVPAQGYGIIEDAAVAAQAGRIAWVGARSALPRDRARAAECIDLQGAWLTPGLIDAHTHLAFAGDRSAEFEQRLQGLSYPEILRQGGGILSTVRAVQACAQEQLTQLTLTRAARMAASGITTLEIKSGYGMNLEHERKQLRAASAVGERLDMRVRRTYLGAHALPPQYREHRQDFLREVTQQVLPALAAEGLVDAVDAFCEPIAFSVPEVAQLFDAAQALGLPVKLHADQLSDAGGAELAARYQALSADHIEYSNQQGIERLAQAGTVAVLLPAAFHYLRESRVPPVEALRAAGVPIAIASDCNPGTAPVLAPGAMMNMACVLFRLTPCEALAGYTREAARALGLLHEVGTIEVGKSADFAIWHCSSPAELSYWIDGLAPVGRVYRGVPSGMKP